MSPDKNQRKSRRQAPKEPSMDEVRCGPSADDAHEIAYFKRLAADDPEESIPGRAFRDSCPVGLKARFDRVLVAVATAPPMKYSGGGQWEATHGVLAGRYEVRQNFGRTHYRLFCLLDYNARDDHGKALEQPLLVIIDGRHKQRGQTLPAAEYQAIKDLGDEYLAHNPRSIA